MFGLIKDNHQWSFAAFGKHPSAADYLELGASTPVLTGFSLWMEQGFSQLTSGVMHDQDLSWEFWAKGPNGKTIIGMMKSSRDKIGRGFPFLMIGEGKMQDASEKWNLMPFACEATWNVFERLYRLSWKSLKSFDRSMLKIKSPKESWAACQNRLEKMKSTEISREMKRKHIDYMNKMNNVDGLARLERFVVRVDVGKNGESPVFAVKLLSLLKTRLKTEPGAVFMGGMGQVKRLVFLKGTPVAEDFGFIWNSAVSEHERHEL